MDSTLACLATWMPRQRWYAAKGRPPSLRLVSWWDLPPAHEQDADARIRTFLVADEGALPVVLYQIPVVSRATETVDAALDHIIGSPEPGTTFIDGPFDPAYARALIRLVTRGGEGRGPRTVASGRPDATRTARRAPDGERRRGRAVEHVGDLPRRRAMPIICKVYRQLHPGFNPDIELPNALADAGSPHVPRVGRLDRRRVAGPRHRPGNRARGRWRSRRSSSPASRTRGAWRCAPPRAAEDFRRARRTRSARRPPTSTCRSRELFPTRQPQAADRADAAASWRRRLAIAIAEVPADRRAPRRDRGGLRPGARESSGRGCSGSTATTTSVRCCRCPRRGWVLLDFEGEPLRPMAERTRPDLALRDVAGMLRSFDYVSGLPPPRRAGPVARDGARVGAQPRDEAFLDGYAAASGADLAALARLLAALELDKAVYEAIYESRNRPTWVSIPLRAIARLVERPARVG